MAELKAGIFIVVIVLYFILFFTITASVQVFNNEIITGIDYNTSLNYNAGLQCDMPRLQYSQDGSSDFFDTNYASSTLKCSKTSGVLGNETCLNIEGCVWEQITTGKFLFTCFFGGCETYYSCTGIINYTHYGFTSDDIGGSIVTPFVDAHDNSPKIFGMQRTNRGSVCDHPIVVYNESMCNMFSCDWDYPKLENLKPRGLLSSIWAFVSFEYEFGFTNEILDQFMTLIFFYIPLLLLSFSIWFLFR